MIEIAGVTPAGRTAPSTNGAANAAAPELVRAPAEAGEAARPDLGSLQRTCLAVLRSEWTTLALVAVDAGTPVQPLASALAEVARAYRLRAVRVLNGSAATAAQVAQLLDELATARAGEGRVVIAAEDPRASPAGAALLVHADAVVLVVRLGTSELRTVEATVELVGRERVIGCVVAR